MRINWLYLSDLRTMYVQQGFELPDLMAEPHYEVAAGDLYAWAVALGLELRPAPRDGVLIEPGDHCVRIMPVIKKVEVEGLNYTPHVDFLEFTFLNNDVRRRHRYNGVYLVDLAGNNE